jgi:hypothetical protein
MNSNPNPRQNDNHIFWGALAPCEHFLQIYEDNSTYLDALETYVSGGIHFGDGVIVIATPQNRKALKDRLYAKGIDLGAVIEQDQYIALDAEETLAKFMVKGWPDKELFTKAVTSLLARAGANGRRVRAFGEMVVLLWSQGDTAATLRLEHLWVNICVKEKFSLFCAYPKECFTQDNQASINAICSAHTRMVDAAA